MTKTENKAFIRRYILLYLQERPGSTKNHIFQEIIGEYRYSEINLVFLDLEKRGLIVPHKVEGKDDRWFRFS